MRVVPRLVFPLLTLALGAAHAETLWRRDWESIAAGPVGTGAFAGPGLSPSVETGTHFLTVVSGTVRNFDHAGVGGFDLIANAPTETFGIQIALTGGTTYAPERCYTMDFVIGTGASAARTGDWFLEFGTVEGGVFVPLLPFRGESAYQSGSLTLGELENFQDDENNVDRFGYTVGGRLLSLKFVPPPHVAGQAIAFRFGTTESDLFAGFSDMRLDADPVVTHTVTTLADDATSPPAGSLRKLIADAGSGDRIVFDHTLSGGTITLDGEELLIDKDLIIDGTTAGSGIQLSGQQQSRIFRIAGGVTVGMSHLGINHGLAPPGVNGGGILNGGTLTLYACSLENNSTGDGEPGSSEGGGGGDGGGIANAGTLTLHASTLAGNSTGRGGDGGDGSGFGEGGEGGDGGDGGGIYNAGTLTLHASTLAGNSTGRGGDGFGGGFGGFGGFGGDGGAIYHAGTLSVASSTLSGNSTGNGGNGGNGGDGVGGVGEDGVGGDGGGIYQRVGSCKMTNVILAVNTIGPNGRGPDLFKSDGAIAAEAVNLLSTTGFSGLSEGPNVLVASDPKLGPLADNGGSTMTLLPLPGSPALDAGLAGPWMPATDQRGLPRVSGSALDIGAIEVQVPLADGLLGYWPFDETSGTTAADLSGGGNDGSLLNFAGGNGQWVPGRIGNAVALDGSNDWISAVSPLPAATTAVSFAGWVWLDTASDWASIMKNWGATQNGQFHLGLQADSLRVSNFLTDGTNIIDQADLPTGQWQHLAFTYDGARHRLYRNGVEVGVGAIDTVTTLDKPTSQFQAILAMGAKTGNDGLAPDPANPSHWDGKFDEFALWGRALGASEIAGLHDQGLAGTPLTAAPGALKIVEWQRLSSATEPLAMSLAWDSNPTATYRIEFSTDGTDWTTIPPIEDIPATGVLTRYQLSLDPEIRPAALVRVVIP